MGKMRKYCCMVMSMTFMLINNAFSQAASRKIILISTNDPHGRLDNFPKMAAYVQFLKRTNPEVFVLNAGDLVDGNPIIDQIKDKGAPIIDIMNSVPYDVSCLGNHELELNDTILRRRVSQSTSVFVDANIKIANGSVAPPFKSYTTLIAGDGLKIAVFGLTATSTNPCTLHDLVVTEPIQAALSLDTLRHNHDIVIGLTHIGFHADSILATKMPGVDIIIGGHSHTAIPHGKFVNGVLITQTGSYMKYLGKTILTIENNRIVNKTFELVDFSTIENIDSGLDAKIKGYNETIDLDKQVGIANADFPDKESIGYLRADAIATELNLQIAFDHSRNISFTHLPAGKITLGDVYKMDPFNYKIYRYYLTAAEIRSLIKAASAYNAIKPPLYCSGINYTLIRSSEGKQDSIILKKGRRQLSERKRYSVGINSFVACRFMPDNLKYDTIAYTTPELLLKFLADHKRVDYSKTRRVDILK